MLLSCALEPWEQRSLISTLTAQRLPLRYALLAHLESWSEGCDSTRSYCASEGVRGTWLVFTS